NPVIVAGDRVALSGAQAALVALAELLGAPIFENYASEYNVPAAHPQYLGAFSFAGDARQLDATLADCDVLLCVGAPLFQIIFPKIEPILPRGTKLVQIDLLSWELNKNLPADVAMIADPKAALTELAELVRAGRTPAYAQAAAARAAALAERTAATRARYRDYVRAHW